jgi:tetratricopeptide (TPR) repeat protein
MCRVVLRAAAALLILGAVAAPARADDASTCRITPESLRSAGRTSKTPDEVIAACNRLIERNSNDAVARHSRGLAYAATGENDRAIADFSEAIRIDPGYASAYNLRGNTHSRKREYNRAIEDYDHAIRIDPKGEIYVSRGNINILKGDDSRGDDDTANRYYDHAITDFNQAIRINPALASAYAGRGVAHSRKHEFDLAIDDFDHTIRLEPKSANAHSERGRINIDKGDSERDRGDGERAKAYYDRAIADFDQAIQINPALAFAYGDRGLAHERKGEFDLAIDDFNRAIRLDPKLANAYGGRGEAWYGKHDYGRAIDDYGEVIRLDPKNAKAYKHRGDAYFARQDYDHAISDYDAAIRLDPSLPEARQNRERAVAAMAPPPGPREAAVAPQQLQEKPVATEASKPAPQQEKPAATEGNKPAPASQPATPPAQSEPVQVAVADIRDRRVALVIGNAAYRHANPLANPVNDARGVRDALQKLRFDVIYGEDLDLKGLRRLIGQFAGRARSADVAVVYFAGHGATFSDTSYVVPVDAEFTSLDEVTYELVPVETLVGELRNVTGVRIVILDACRDNEAERSLKLKVAGTLRGGPAEVTRGLGPLKSPEGMIVAFATQYLSTANDAGSGGHSPFTAALLDNIATPGVDVTDMFRKVGRDVLAATGRKQRPELVMSIFERYVLAPAAAPPGAR